MKMRLPKQESFHRSHEYDERGFQTLLAMQRDHFWYRGRHRFLLEAVNRHLPESGGSLSAIDFGGGAGGWVQYLAEHMPERFKPIALADSSLVALELAASVLPPNAQRYQIDLMQLNMREQWDAAFLLDVIEHLPDDLQALRQGTRSTQTRRLSLCHHAGISTILELQR